MRRSPLLALAAIAVLALLGCAQPVASPTEPASAPEPSASASPEPADAGTTPLFDVGCADVIPAEALESLLGRPVASLTSSLVSLDGPMFQLAAAEREGALYCRWDALGVDPVGQVTLMATAAGPDAFSVDAVGEDGFANPSASTGLFPDDREWCSEGSSYEPGAGSCEWRVYSDDVWAVFAFEIVPTEELVPPAVRQRPDGSFARPTPRLDGALAAIVRDAMSALVEGRTDEVPLVITATPCSTLLADPGVEAALGDVDAQYDNSAFESGDRMSSTATLGGGIPFLASARAGWSHCSVQRSDGYFTTIRVVPDGASLLDGALGESALRDEPLEGGGVGACFSSEDGGECRVAVPAGDDLVIVRTDSLLPDLSSVRALADAVVALIRGA